MKINDRQEERDYFIVGHELRVDLEDAGWTVSVDGKAFPRFFVTPYAAWAVGAAESYRLGLGDRDGVVPAPAP